MPELNSNFQKLSGNYLFAEIGKRIAAYKAQHPDNKVISLGIGDVTRPLPPAVIEALHSAVDEMADPATFQGYPPAQGYEFLQKAILNHDYAVRGVSLTLDEIFISDGAKSDTANISDLFDVSNKVALCDPVYPVYFDTNVMAGRTGELLPNQLWSNIVYMPCVKDNGFMPEIPSAPVDLIYLCFPNNPTGGMISAQKLKQWVDYALEHQAVILYDAAYEAFITGDFPHSIFEIEGAKRCAIEFRSFSKTAGFTGVRCSYTVVPKELEFNGISVNSMWARRQSTKYNGTSYIIQKAAAATYSDQGRKQCRDTIAYYLNNAKIIREGLRKSGFEVFGGENAPYIWLKTPDNLTSWEFFDLLLNELEIVGTPGSGFGPSGEGYFRLTAFGTNETALDAVKRIKSKYNNAK